MTESEKKDIILRFLNDESRRMASYQLTDYELIFSKGITDYKEMSYLINQISKEGYLDFDGQFFKYNYETGKFISSSGYVKSEIQNESELNEKKLLKELSFRKTTLETKLAKWQVKIFWPAFIFTVIGSILGIISFFMQVIK